MSTEELGRTAVILVEYYSDGQVAARAREAIDAGLRVVVADNTGRYEGPGCVTATGGNVGFGAACNTAVSVLGSDVDVFILQNPDATINAAGLSLLVGTLRRGPWVALAPALEADRFRPAGYAVPRRRREPALVAADVIRARSGWASRSLHRAATEPGARDEVAGAKVQPGRFASAALLALDRKAYEQVGGFDERYFLYVEDLDLWQRLHGVGEVGFMSEVVAHHAPGSGSSGSTTLRTLLRWLGRELFFSTHVGSWRSVRALHRSASRLLSTAGDQTALEVAGLLSSWRQPAQVQEDVRRLLENGQRTPR